MRYVLIDRFTALEEGRRARAVKCVTLGEPFLRGLAAYPPALVLEALIQTGGVLTRAASGFRRMTVLGKIESAEFPSEAQAGDTLEMDVRVTLSRPEGNLCEGTATVGDRIVGRASFLIVYVPKELEPPHDERVRERRELLMRAVGLPPGER